MSEIQDLSCDNTLKWLFPRVVSVHFVAGLSIGVRRGLTFSFQDFPGGISGAWASHPVLSEPGKPWGSGMGKIHVCWACETPNEPYPPPNYLGPSLSPAKWYFYPLERMTAATAAFVRQNALFSIKIKKVYSQLGVCFAFFNINCSLKMNFGERNFILLKCLLWIFFFFLLLYIELEVFEIDLFLWSFTMWVSYQNF